MKNILHEVQVEKVSEKIVDQLENLIKEGKLAPGSKLPSERQLIEILGVGRSSLREAINKLETMGYVEIKKRKGIFVKSITSTLQLDPLKDMLLEDQGKIMQLYEIRSDLEEASAYAAAVERSEGDLQEIEACLKSFESPDGGDLHFSWELDQAFHSSIARASHNFFRIHAILNILDFSREFIKSIIEGFADSKDNVSIIVQQHQAIVTAIQERDADKAKRAMKEHLDWTNQQLIDYFR